MCHILQITEHDLRYIPEVYAELMAAGVGQVYCQASPWEVPVLDTRKAREWYSGLKHSQSLKNRVFAASLEPPIHDVEGYP